MIKPTIHSPLSKDVSATLKRHQHTGVFLVVDNFVDLNGSLSIINYVAVMRICIFEQSNALS